MHEKKVKSLFLILWKNVYFWSKKLNRFKSGAIFTIFFTFRNFYIDEKKKLFGDRKITYGYKTSKFLEK